MTKSEEARDVVRLLGYILLGGVVALAVCCALLFLAAAAISVGWLKEDASFQITVAACTAGTACGALFAILRCKKRAVLVGLAVAAAFFLLLLSVGMLAYEDMALEQGGAALLCGSLCGGAAVGLLCTRREKKKRPRRDRSAR